MICNVDVSSYFSRNVNAKELTKFGL